MSVGDFRSKDLETIDTNDISTDVEHLLLSNNKLTELPHRLFVGKHKIWDIDLSKNQLTDVKALQIFKILHLLDLSDNCLEIDEILDLRPIFIFNLVIHGNGFQRFAGDNILYYVALLKRAWAIEGFFVTDYMRKQAKNFKKSMKFSETILAARRLQIPEHKTCSTAVAAQSFLSGTECKFHEPGVYANPHGTELRDLCKKPQIERLIYIWKSEKIRFEFPPSRQIDKLSMICGILAHHWLNVPIAAAARVVSREFWICLDSEIETLQNWEEFVLLLDFSKDVACEDEMTNEIWKTLNVQKYLETGQPPLIGSSARMILCSILFDSDLTDAELESIPDIKCYDKLMRAIPLKETESLIERVYHEVIEELPYELRRLPQVRDVISVRHPMTDKWVESTITHIGNGRVFTRIGNNIVVHLPMTALFWDGKGKWREMRPASDEKPKGTNIAHTFLTLAEAVNSKPDPRRYAVPLSVTGTSKRNITPVDRKFFLKTSQNMMNASPFVEQKKPKRKLTEKEKGYPSFRGIMDPVRPKTSVHRVTTPSRRPTQIIQGVINIVLGDEIAPGRYLRKFHVKVQNVNSKRISYAWIHEDEIPEEDVRRLVDMYKRLIESKMTVLPNL